jgi:hypothetical protein
MKKNFVFTLLISVFSFTYATAQDNKSRNNGLALEFGAAVNYYHGLPDRNFGSFENDRINWQANGTLGITLARDKADRRTMIAAFGGLGFNNKTTITHLLADQQYTTLALEQAGTNNFYQLEGGFIFADLFRISTGVGQQNFNSQPLVSADGVQTNATHLKFYSSTVGIKLNLRSVTWVINCNFAYGKDYNKTVMTPGTGLMFRL